ncbi:excinuclease ABC subunit UvrC [Chitinispirillales bacterium ANBcel5]|uniref:excinuclease ABC subunit UvrC n=1 Tax=Cellulosispirillum alkaliphilum TaxID=3039283 RepID=UPI002A500730|nr:excinuclease ABC subunit UvrC [Chitinispirillales bacterium ANBcel5]
MNEKRLHSLLEQISRFPENPGVYLMKDESDAPIYIGKAVNLKSRVRSYFFDAHEERAHIPVMLQKLHHIDWIATNNETEALILEANLIRKVKPRYNVDLRDDKHFPYLKVTTYEPFPRLLIVRKVVRDGSVYFGPYTDVRAMRRTADYARKIFRIRNCNKSLPLQKPVRPCINYSMKRCSGPCGEKISRVEYREAINDLIRFLKGRRSDLIRELEEKMAKASEHLEFEKAAGFRDQIQLIKDASRLQQVDLKLSDTDCDVFGIAHGDRVMCLAVLNFRGGLLMANRHFLFKKTVWDFSEANHDYTILQFYTMEGQQIPKEVLIPPDESFSPAILQRWFDEQGDTKTEVIAPQRGVKKQLIAMAERNAKLYLAQKTPPSAMEDIKDLQKVLALPYLPETIEAFDISNLGESFTVAGMVQFKDGMPNKSGYRRYKIKTVEGQNDFAMMMEVVGRRLKRLKEEGKAFPDLLLIDGGKGQLHSAMQALKDFDNPPLIASLAKQEEILFSPCIEGEIRLPPTHPARKLVQRIRDEVHRYAITYHRKIRGKQFFSSSLENLPAIGKKKATLLLKHFGSVKRIKEAEVAEIAKVEGFSEKSAQQLKNNLSQL